MRFFVAVEPRPGEVSGPRPGDDVVPHPDVVMDRAFAVPAAPEQVWPWLVQLGKRRAGWYLPRQVERFVPRGRRAARVIDPRWQQLAIGDVIPDYGGPDETFEVVSIRPPTARRPGTLVYRSRRGRTDLSWAILLVREHAPDGVAGSRVHLRLRLGPVRYVRLAETVGGAFDLLTIAGMAAGLQERLAEFLAAGQPGAEQDQGRADRRSRHATDRQATGA